ncbi:MAG: hypothetical protein J0M30_07600 [Chitinophagales bacterium]|nr:hypothetical protein [Chitinophagales bacterium]
MPSTAYSRESSSFTYCLDESNIWSFVKTNLDEFPNEDSDVMPGVRWGNYCQLFTPSFWKLQFILASSKAVTINHRLSNSILEEIIVCLLGGYGIPSEIGIAAFIRLKSQDLCSPGIGFEEIYEVLSEPFELQQGKKIKYRFAKQKSRFIHKLLNREDIDLIPTDCDLTLRNWLLSIDGVGLKTASWITRNWLSSNKVAIIDIHLLRAGVLTGFFEPGVNINRDYLKLEKQYLLFCDGIGVSASDMDAIIWDYMKRNNRFAIQQFNS